MCVSSSFRTPNFKICKYLTNRISIECSLLLSIGEPSYRTIYACTRVCNKTERRRGTRVRKGKERKGKDEGNSRDGNKRYTTRRIDRIFQHFVTSVISASITIPFGDGRSITDPRIGERRREERRGGGQGGVCALETNPRKTRDRIDDRHFSRLEFRTFHVPRPRIRNLLTRIRSMILDEVGR